MVASGLHCDDDAEGRGHALRIGAVGQPVVVVVVAVVADLELAIVEDRERQVHGAGVARRERLGDDVVRARLQVGHLVAAAERQRLRIGAHELVHVAGVARAAGGEEIEHLVAGLRAVEADAEAAVGAARRRR